MHLKLITQISNLRSLTKVPFFPVKDGQTVLNFETKVGQRLSLYAIQLILTNIQSEIIDKSAIISTRIKANSLGTAHSKIGGPTFVNEKVVHIIEKKLII